MKCDHEGAQCAVGNFWTCKRAGCPNGPEVGVRVRYGGTVVGDFDADVKTQPTIPTLCPALNPSNSVYTQCSGVWKYQFTGNQPGPTAKNWVCLFCGRPM